LAELLVELAEDDAAVARSLRLAVAGIDGADRLAAEVEKRLRTLHRANGYIEWDKVRPLARELDGLRQTVAGMLAVADPHAAVTQMRLLLSRHEGLFERSDDSSGLLAAVFREAGADLGRLWSLVPGRDPVELARELLALLDSDGYGVTDHLLAIAGPALGPEGRAELRRLLQARLSGRASSDKNEGSWDARAGSSPRFACASWRTWRETWTRSSGGRGWRPRGEFRRRHIRAIDRGRASSGSAGLAGSCPQSA
jgi:hypothetical protein